MAEQTLPDVMDAPQSRWKFILSELKPKKSIWTVFNMISVPTVAVAAIIIVYRFIFGLSAVSNVTQSVPWGLWKGFNVVTGVAFAGGAYVLTFMVYILGQTKYKPLVRVTVLNGFLAYTFYAFALILDLGKPWNIINPIIGNSFGTSSVLFLVAWHFMLYIVAQMIEAAEDVVDVAEEVGDHDDKGSTLHHHRHVVQLLGKRGAGHRLGFAQHAINVEQDAHGRARRQVAANFTVKDREAHRVALLQHNVGESRTQKLGVLQFANLARAVVHRGTGIE